MCHRIVTCVAAIAIAVVGLIAPRGSSTPDASDQALDVATDGTDWAPTRSAEGHPEAMVTLDNGDTIAIGDGGWITRRAAGDSTWSPARRELAERPHADTNARSIAASYNSVIVSYRVVGPSRSYHSTYVWRPAAGWSEPVHDAGPVWTGIRGVIGVGRQRYVPGRGWTTLPEIPLEPLAMGADTAGRVTAVGRVGPELRIARFTPGEGWAPSIRLTELAADASIDLAVAPPGHRAITVRHDSRLLLLRRLGDRDWEHQTITEGWAPEHQVHLDTYGRASVVWVQSGPDGEPLLLTSRLPTADDWEPVRLLARLTTPDRRHLIVDGTNTGELAVAYRQPDVDGWTTSVRRRDPDGQWSEPVEVAAAGDAYGVTMSPDACTTGFAWSDPMARFTARTLGPCAGVEPEPADERTSWMSPTSPASALTYELDRIHVARTSDGHTLLGWTSLQERHALVSERIMIGYTEPMRLGPEGETCHLRRLDDFDATAQAVLDCGHREWYAQAWSADSGWQPPTPMPDADGEVDLDVNREGGTAAVFGFEDDPRPDRVLYRPAVDAAWRDLPKPPAFDSGRIDWSVHLTDADEVVLVDGTGREYAIYRPSTGVWSPVQDAPLTESEAVEWQVSDDGMLLAWQAGSRTDDRFAVGSIDGEWSDPRRLDGHDRGRDVALAAGRVVLVELGGSPARLQARDFDIDSQIWSASEVLGDGDGLAAEPELIANAAGDAVVTLAHVSRFGYDRPDSLWHRAADSTTWSTPEYVPDGYDLTGSILPDGTLAVTSDQRAADPGVWMSVHDPS